MEETIKSKLTGGYSLEDGKVLITDKQLTIEEESHLMVNYIHKEFSDEIGCMLYYYFQAAVKPRNEESGTK